MILAYTDSNGFLTGDLAEYVVPVRHGGYWNQSEDPGQSSNTFSGNEEELKYTWKSVPQDFNYVPQYTQKGTTYRQITSNWRMAPTPGSDAVKQQCGPNQDFCACVYDYPAPSR
jgi:hypothetical protein